MDVLASDSTQFFQAFSSPRIHLIASLHYFQAFSADHAISDKALLSHCVMPSPPTSQLQAILLVASYLTHLYLNWGPTMFLYCLYDSVIWSLASLKSNPNCLWKKKSNSEWYRYLASLHTWHSYCTIQGVSLQLTCKKAMLFLNRRQWEWNESSYS